MCIDSKTKVKQIDEVIFEKSPTQNQLIERQKEYVSVNSTEIYGEKGARILNLFYKFKFEKETKQHYQYKIINSSTTKEGKIIIGALIRVPGPYQTIKKVKQLNRYVTGTIASEVQWHLVSLKIEKRHL